MKIVQIFSGGMDSATLLYWLRHRGDQVWPLGIDYGQRHGRELQYAKRLCDHLGLTYEVADLTGLKKFMGGSSQTDPTIPVPHGHYAAENMKLTVVPNRNMLMLAIAAAYAISLKADAVAYGAHAGDHTIYPDCRATFTQTMREAFLNCDWHPVDLLVPFQTWSKGDIAKEGTKLGVPYEMTWTCYEGGQVHCGLCGACTERREAFQEAGVSDPTIYKEVSHV